jgi:hypothetical protein
MRTLLLAPLALAIAVACETYVPPPTATIEGESDGVLPDPSAPFVVDFADPIDLSTLTLEVALYEVDADGNLPDERGAASTPLHLLFAHDPDNGDQLGTGTLSDDRTSYTIVPRAPFPVGTKLILLVEPGLSDGAGHTTTYRQRIPFSYAFQCTGGVGTKVLTSGVYFFLLDVQEPIGTQIQIWAALDVDPTTGLFTGQFTRAHRNPDGTRCTPTCDSTTVCQTLPGPPQCVVPSTRAGTVDEFPDWLPLPDPPTGFSFTVKGCAEDQSDGSAALATAPADLVVQQPAVTVGGLTMTASFAPDALGVVRGTGALQSPDVELGTASLGQGQGTMTARSVSTSEAPPGIPPVPTQ